MDTGRCAWRRFLCVLTIGAFLMGPVGPPDVFAYGSEQERRDDSWSYNTDYLYAMTRGIRDNDDAHPGMKMTILPVTILLDTVLLPIALIAGLFGQPDRT